MYKNVHDTENFLEKFLLYYEEFEDTKGVIRILKSKKDRQHNGQTDKQRSTKHYTEKLNIEQHGPH